MDLVEIGKLAEINLDVKISESSVNAQELRGRVEIVNSTLQRKEIFTTGTSVVVAAK